MRDRDFGFRYFMTPRIIGAVWILLVIMAAVVLASSIIVPLYWGEAPWALLSGPTIVAWTVGLITARFFLEYLSVVFSIHDRLTDILDELRTRPPQTTPTPTAPARAMPARPKLYAPTKP